MYQLRNLLLPYRRVLASSSPRRREILSFLDLSWEIIPANIDENNIRGIDVFDTVGCIARSKALVAARQLPGALVVAADTEVIIEGRLTGKPANAEEGLYMLSQLSGRTHIVSTAVAIILPDRREHLFREDSLVTFSEIPQDELVAYLRTAGAYDKAGGYGVQDGFGASFIEKIDGCFFNVMGFPLNRFRREMLRLFS